MIVVGETTAPCPVCDGRGRSFDAVYHGQEVRADGSRGRLTERRVTGAPCVACAGTGRILQAVDSRDEQP